TLIVPLASLNQILVTPVQDRYAYAAAFGLCLIIGTAAGVGPGFSWPRVSAAMIGLLTLTYAVCLWRLEPIWADDTRLFTECAREFPILAFYRKAYGGGRAKEGNRGRATHEFEAAEKLDPNNASTHEELADLYKRLG